MTRQTVPLAVRLWRRSVLRLSGCVEWTGYVDRATGYGQIGRGAGTRKLVLTHRAAWELTNGTIPEGLSVLHTCDNRKCVAPAHLFLGSHADNMADMAAKGRGFLARGDLNGNTRLSSAAVRDIRTRSVPGPQGNTAELAQEYGITPQYVRQLATARWRVSA